MSSILRFGTSIGSILLVVFLTARDFAFGTVRVDEARKQSETVLVKIGGSSITNKAVRESLNHTALDWFVGAISKSISPTFTAPSSSQECQNDPDEARINLSYVIIHGAGSFGHFSAKEYGLKGQNEKPDPHHYLSIDENRFRKRGLAETRLSVQKLNQHIVAALLSVGVNAVGISPCFGIPSLQAHATKQSYPAKQLEEVVRQTIRAGLVPVLHGDACLHGEDGGILSGDTLMEILGASSWVQDCIFITDVDGVYNEDPRSNPEAQLLRHLLVDPVSGDITTELNASGSSHRHDVTGGLATKLKSAAKIAAAGTNVTIVKYDSRSAEQALRRESDIEVGSLIAPIKQ